MNKGLEEGFWLSSFTTKPRNLTDLRAPTLIATEQHGENRYRTGNNGTTQKHKTKLVMNIFGFSGYLDNTEHNYTGTQYEI